MITFGVAETEGDLQQILHLQKVNLPINISKNEAQEQGFVTVQHTLDLLIEMNSPFPHIVARNNGKVIAYALVMLRSLKKKIPILVSMFDQINKLTYNDQVLKDSKYFVMGQICIDKAYRGKGVFNGLYEEMKRRMVSDFDFIITEIATRNTRSMKAHFNVGFENIKEYQGETGEDWAIVLLSTR